MPDLGPSELLIILVVVVLIFGGSRVAELGGSLGKGIKEFKKSMKDDDEPAAVVAEPVLLNTGTPEVVAPVSAVTIVCANCGTANSLDARFCSECGQTVAGTTSTLAPAGAKVCARCGAGNALDARFCNECGAAMLAEGDVPATPAADR